MEKLSLTELSQKIGLSLQKTIQMVINNKLQVYCYYKYGAPFNELGDYVQDIFVGEIYDRSSSVHHFKNNDFLKLAQDYFEVIINYQFDDGIFFDKKLSYNCSQLYTSNSSVEKLLYPNDAFKMKKSGGHGDTFLKQRDSFDQVFLHYLTKHENSHDLKFKSISDFNVTRFSRLLSRDEEFVKWANEHGINTKENALRMRITKKRSALHAKSETT